MAKKRFYGSKGAGEYGESRHNADRFNDEKKHQQNSRDGHMMRDSGSQDYMGMPTSARRGLERPEMIYEDHRAIANLPQEVMMKPYPRTGPYLPEGLDDSRVGVDRQMDYDDSQRRGHFFPKKV
jgi:hypothetical protein